MSRVIAKVSLNRDSGLPEDVVVNTMHFEDDNPDVDNFVTGGTSNTGGLMDRIATFYAAIGTNLGTQLAGTGRVDLYDWDAPKPRIPVAGRTFTHTTGTVGWPGEVALCVSFRAQRASGVAGARQRGRIFIGPLAMPQSQIAGAGDIRPNDTIIDTFLQAFRTMSRGGSGTYRLAIYSPTTFATTADADAAWSDAQEAWIDNAYDTMRKRGARALHRRQVNLGATAVPTTIAA